MNSFMSWVGGKKNLRDAVLARFPPYYERYIEVFGGAGWVLFHKPPGADFEVYNDFNSNLANLYRCVRDKPNRLKYKLRYVLNSREDFDLTSSLHKRGILQNFTMLTERQCFTSLYVTAMQAVLTALEVSHIRCGRTSL